MNEHSATDSETEPALPAADGLSGRYGRRGLILGAGLGYAESRPATRLRCSEWTWGSDYDHV
jgi:hypothetical protein